MSTLNAGTLNVTEKLNLPTYNVSQRDALSGVSTGFMIFNTEENVVQVWNGTEWTSGGSTGTDGSTAERAASSLQELVDAGVTADGVYWFKDSAEQTYQAYVKMQNPIDGVPWILVFNINTDSAQNSQGGIPHWDNTSFWTTANSQGATDTSPWAANVKTRAYDKYPVSKFCFMVHKQGGFDNTSGQLHGYGIYANDNYPGQTMYTMMSSGTNKTVSTSARESGQDYSNGLTWNNNRPQILGGDLFITNTLNGYNNASYNLMFNVTNNFNSSNEAKARISTSGASGNGNYGYTAGGVGVKHGHNGNWGGYAGYCPVSAYCGGKEIYGSNTNGVNYLGGINPNSPFINCMQGGNGIVNYNLALWVR